MPKEAYKRGLRRIPVGDLRRVFAARWRNGVTRHDVVLRQVERAHYNPSLRIFHIHRIRRRDTKYLARRRQRAVVRHRSRRSVGGTHRRYWRERCLVIVPISSVGRRYLMYLPGSSVLIDKSFVSRVQQAACSLAAISAYFRAYETQALREAA